MMAWPAAAAARRLVAGRAARVVVGAWALMAWDVALDPQMVTEGHWRWLSTDPHLPGIPDVPLTNFAGWLLVSAVIAAALQPLLDRKPGADGVPLALYLWTAVSSVLLLAAFEPRAAAACWTAVAMGVVAVPLAARLWAARPRAARWAG
jgi:putative membrane protein